MWCVCVCGVTSGNRERDNEERKNARESIAEFTRKYRRTDTNSSYRYHQELFRSWCRMTSKRPPQDENECAEQVCQYLIHCHEREEEENRWSASYFNTARSAISDLFKFTYSNAIGEHPLVTTTIATIRKVAPPPTQKEPFTQEHFRKIFAVIDLTNFRDVRDYYMMLIMYAMGRRAQEATDLLMKNVVVNDTDSHLTIIHTSKTKSEERRGNSTNVRSSQHHDGCRQMAQDVYEDSKTIVSLLFSFNQDRRAVKQCNS